MQNPFRHQRTLDEAQEESERLEVEKSIALNKAEIRKLNASGLTAKSFGFDVKAIKNWLKTHM